MPLYEGIGLISEKHAVVLDIGWDTTKCGYAGEVSPRCIIPSKVDNVGILDTTDPDKLYAILVDFVHRLYFKWLLVNPKDRRVVIVENLLGSSLFKETLVKVLFKHYEVSSVLCAPSHLVSLFSLGVNTGLVLDVGHKEATLVPVYEGVPILAAWQAQPLAGEAIQEAVKADLICRGLVTSSVVGDSPARVGDNPELLTEELVRDIALRCCFMTNINRGRQLRTEVTERPGERSPTTSLAHLAPLVNYPMSGSQFLQVDGITREGSSELLWNLDNDFISVASMVLDAILACPLDCRRQLADSLVIIGGTSMMPGFKSRLNQELKSLLSDPKYEKLNMTSFKMYKPPGQPLYTAWLGGAIFGASDVVVTRSLTREQYLKDPTVPDWSNLRFNTVYNQERQG